MEKKIAMFSTGKIVVNEDGKIREASQEEAVEHLASQFPEEKLGMTLSAVRYEPTTGFAYGKYAAADGSSKTFRKQLVQVAEANDGLTEPVNAVQDKADPDPKVPRDKSKAKPTINVDRPDVVKPKEVRKEEYKRGKGAEDLHTDVVPRSKSNSGLSGSKSTTFDDEKADKATSGNPDTYVQTFTPSEKPQSAGSENNHAAASTSNVKIKSESEFYAKLTACKDEDKSADPKAEKDDEKDKKSEGKKNLPPWLKDKKVADEDSKEKKEDTEKSAQLMSELKKAQQEITQLKAEVSRAKVREERQKLASAYVLALRDLNPVKYASAEAFNTKVEEAVKKMSSEAIETAIEEVENIRQEAAKNRSEMIKQASERQSAEDSGGLATAIVIQRPEGFGNNSSDLKDILMQGTSLGRKMAEFDSYVPHTKE